jgi:hypothetical protein
MTKNFDLRMWRLAAMASFGLAVVSVMFVYSALERMQGAYRANRILSEQLADPWSGALVELAKDASSGDIMVRVGGENGKVAYFAGVCPPQYGL